MAYPYPPNPYMNPYQVNTGYPMMGMQPIMQMPMAVPVIQMPVSMQAVYMANNYSWSQDKVLEQMAAQLGLDEEDEEDEEEEEEWEEDETEEYKVEKKKEKKKNKKRQKKAAKVQEKLKEDPDILEKFRDMYVANLWDHLQKTGTLDPTEGTVKPYTKYTSDDPVCIWMNQTDGVDLASKDWDCEVDCRYFHEGMKGLGTDEDAIIHVVSTRCNLQRQEMKKMYKTLYGEDLIEKIEGELSGDFLDLVQALFIPPAHFDALCIKKAIYGAGTDKEALIDTLMTRTNDQIQEIRQVYAEVVDPREKFPDDKIEQDIENDTSGDFKRLLISASQGNRQTIDYDTVKAAVQQKLQNGNPTGQFEINMEALVDMDRVKVDAKHLFEAGEDRLGTDEETFIRVFARRHHYHMQAVYNEYVKLTQRDILNTIDRETSGSFEKGMYAIAMTLKCRPLYYAQRLKYFMDGLGTDDQDLIRVIVSRSEIDMVQIKKCFLELTHKTLFKWIEEDTSFHYKKLLCAVVGRN